MGNTLHFVEFVVFFSYQLERRNAEAPCNSRTSEGEPDHGLSILGRSHTACGDMKSQKGSRIHGHQAGGDASGRYPCH
jgi:hypothetical protein